MTIRPVIWAALAVLLVSPCSAEYMQTEFRIPGSDHMFRARLSTDRVFGSVPQQLDIAEANPDNKDYVITDRVELTGLCCPQGFQYVTLAGRKGGTPAFLVWGVGSTHDFVYVVEVDTRVPTLPLLITRLSDHHEGGKPQFRFDKSGNLQTVTLEYAAMHELSDEAFAGHIVVARTYRWLPEKGKFARGSFFVSKETEAKLSLSDTLCYPGSDRAGVDSSYNDKTRTVTYRFKPTGILRDKVPTSLEDAPMIEVVVGPDSKITSTKSVSVDKHVK
jgi:hypothetical protein